VEPEGGRLYDLPGKIKQVVFGYKMTAERRLYYKDLIEQSGHIVELLELTVSPRGGFELAICAMNLAVQFGYYLIEPIR
jgi:hypothetical protein